MDLSQIPDEVLIARGKYSTLNNALRDKRADMTKACTQIQTGLGLMLKHGTSDDAMTASPYIQQANDLLSEIERLMAECHELISEKLILRDIAYPK